MNKKVLNKTVYLLASFFMILGQLGIMQVFAETTNTSLQISTASKEAKVGETFAVDLQGTPEQLSNFQFTKDGSISEVKKETINDNQQKIYLKGNKAGTFKLAGRSGTTVTNELTITITDGQQATQNSAAVSSNLPVEGNSISTPVEKAGIQPAAGNLTPDPKAAGDDPGVTLTATNPIGSQQQVELDVTLSTSAGKLSKDGSVSVSIPKTIVQDPSQLADQIVIGDPFSLGTPAYSEDANGNYVLNVKYDSTKIDQTSAQGYTFKVRFRAPYFENNETVPKEVNFGVQLDVNGEQVSEDKKTSETQPSQSGAPAFLKYSGLPYNEINGQKVYLLDTTPDTYNNNFVIIVNYNHNSYDNVTVNDQLPNNTVLHDGYKILTDVTSGDASPYKHINIYKVDQWNSNGTPKHYTYVTSDFKDKISTTDGSLSVNLGGVSSNDAYVITYGLSVDPTVTAKDFGTRYNDARELENGSQINQSKVPMIIDDSHYQAIKLNKTVDQKTLASKKGTIGYSLTLSSSSDVVHAGTIITDPLPENTRFDKTTSYDPNYISEVSYDKTKNSISYKLLKDIHANESTAIKFDVSYANAASVPGDKIVNKASINYAGSTIYSNDVTTTLAGSAYLYKTDKDSGDPLANAVFKIVDSANKTIVEGLTSDGKGFINSGLLDPGNYSFIEVKAPNGYDLDNTPIPFVVKEGQETPINLSVTNKKTLTGTVVLTKMDSKSEAPLQGAVFELRDKDGKVQQTGLTTGSDGKLTIDNLVPGDYQLIETKAPDGYELDKTPLTFTIEKDQTKPVQVSMMNKKKAPGIVILTKMDSKSEAPLQGAVFELRDKNDNILKSGLTTGPDGKLTIDNLAPGEYQLIETKAPTGYELDKTPLTFTIEKDQTKPVQVSMMNKQKDTGAVILTKKDATSGENLQGAVFELDSKDGKVLQSGLPTGADGKLAIDNLVPGEYQLVETKAPTGHDLDKTPVTFKIETGKDAAVQVSMTNKQSVDSVVLTKTDAATGDKLQGAVFKLEKQDGTPVKNDLTTGPDGKLAVNNLAPGKYQFIETQAPTGYELDKTPVSFTIEKDQETAVQVSKTNKATPGAVILEKIDSETGSKLAGATFELRDKDNKVVLKNLVTDSNGKLAIKKLHAGNYQLVETKAPEGYILDKTPVKFTIKANENTQKQLTKTNKEKGKTVRLEKRDALTNEVLADANFKLIDNHGKTIQTKLVTDKNGSLSVSGLKNGKYSLVETKAPDGYILDQIPLHFVISDKTSFVQLTKLNIRKINLTVKVPHVTHRSHTYSVKTYPKTGESKSTVLTIIGLIVIGLLAVLMWMNRRRQQG
ncbi:MULTISPECIES: SpaA isopeptide-forming pilin-related protein [Enterococcus]|uniref:SpaA isopeptide-forming pilin-related protein n=1 Tax=Enterococcus TaxID=1350 RepID=UPI000EC70D06|nr:MULTISPECIES: SpaA isopeptide-forming pilin-related protein [Enterococcus]HCM87809.1 hypothetical protein [Enterococcus sp.]